MFEKLYKRGPTLVRHRQGPLAVEREIFLRRLAEEGHQVRGSLVIAADYLLVVAEWLRLSERQGESIGIGEIEEQAERWSARATRRFRKGTRSDRARQRFTGIAVRWLTFLGRFQAPKVVVTPFDPWLAEYSHFLRHERGLRESTILASCSHIRQFLCRLGEPPAALATVTIDRVQRMLIEQLEEAHWKRNTVQGYVGALRGFFRFAARHGWTPAKLAVAIDTPRVYQQETIPSGPTWDQVGRLLATTEGDQALNIRDRAILLLLAVYGFRAGEVARLTLENISWSLETLSVERGKTRMTQTFPLCRSVGNAILRYLREVRASTSHRALFLQYWLPLPLKSSGISRIALKRLKLAGITLARPGAHALRHACATHLLEQGLTLKEIGDHLGHQSPDSTRIYAKVNLTQLRCVAELDLGGVA